MRFLISLILILLYTVFGKAQATFNQSINFDSGFWNNAIDLALSEDGIVVTGEYAQIIDSQTIRVPGNVLFFEIGGALDEVLPLDLISAPGFGIDRERFPSGNLAVSDSATFIVGKVYGENNKLAIFSIQSGISPVDTFLIDMAEDYIIRPEGLLSYDGSLFVHGGIWKIGEATSRGIILRIDITNKEVVWQKEFSYSDVSQNSCNDLQPTIDGHLIFSNYHTYGAGTATVEGYELYKINSSGETIGVYEYVDNNGLAPGRLLSSAEGAVYYLTKYHPEDVWAPKDGWINKLNPEMEEVEWSTPLPSEPFSNNWEYNVLDFIEAANGDIIFCGEATGGGWHPDDSHNGFIARNSPDGELKWTKIYRHPNMDAFPIEDFGLYRHGELNKVIETPTGQIIACGHARYSPFQLSAIQDLELSSRLWLLAVDANGCLAGEECQDVIVLDGANTALPVFDIGTRWTYEVETFAGGPAKSVSFETYEIVDTAIVGGQTAFAVEEGSTGNLQYLRQEGSLVYFWDADLEMYQLNYDFSVNSQYGTQWTGQCSSGGGIAMIEVDSVTQETVMGDTLPVQHLRIENNGTIEGDLLTNVYAGIGQQSGGLRLPLGYGLCDAVREITRLRCFDNDSLQYNFVGYSCDSTFVITSTSEVTQGAINIFPNPSSGLINIEGAPPSAPYELYAVDGRLVQSGVFGGNQLFIERPGIYWLKVSTGKHWKIVKVAVL